MRLSIVAAALVMAGGAAFAQGTSPSTAPTSPATPPSTAPAAMSPPASSSTGTAATRPAGVQTPAASVNTSPQTASPSPSAVQTRNTTQRTAAAPVAGRNSFTVSQATRRITSAGYTKVMGLKKDDQGIWRGQAEKDGKPTSVSLDYQGNVTGQ